MPSDGALHDLPKTDTLTSENGIDTVVEAAILEGPTKDFYFLPIPKHLRYHPGKPFHFGLVMNISFGIAGIFLTANMYYSQPLLIQMSNSFNVSYEGVSRIPTLVQAGYAVGLVLISPLADLVRPRPLFLGLVLVNALLTIGLAVTSNVLVFEVIQFLIGVANITPQILVPLTAELASPERRAFAYSIVITGLLLGVLLARVISGVIAEFASWRVVYYMAIGAQACVLAASYFIIPDCPAKNKGTSYWKIIWSMAKYLFTEPVMVQIVLINIATSACFASFWVTLTFLLGGPPYFYSTLVIGLFGLLGMAGVLMGPFAGRIVDGMTPWHSILISTLLLAVPQAIQVGAGGIHISAVILACLGIDAFRQWQNVALAMSMYSISRDAIARLNAVFVLSFYAGQLMGTSAGTTVFVKYGWRASAGLNLAWLGFQVFILLLRGPHCRRYTWFGYEGGIASEKRSGVVDEKNSSKSEV